MEHFVASASLPIFCLMLPPFFLPDAGALFCADACCPERLVLEWAVHGLDGLPSGLFPQEKAGELFRRTLARIGAQAWAGGDARLVLMLAGRTPAGCFRVRLRIGDFSLSSGEFRRQTITVNFFAFIFP